MDSMSAFAKVEANRGKPLMVFDWEKAATIILEQTPTTARAGLSGDWEYTGGDIWLDGRPVPADETYVFLASTWAAPELDIDGVVMECWRYQKDTPSWGSVTYWPPEAVAIIEAAI